MTDNISKIHDFKQTLSDMADGLNKQITDSASVFNGLNNAELRLKHLQNQQTMIYNSLKILAKTAHSLKDDLAKLEKDLAWQDALSEIKPNPGQPAPSLIAEAFNKAMASNNLAAVKAEGQKLFGAPTSADAPPVFNGSNPVSLQTLPGAPAKCGPLPNAPHQPVKVTGQTPRPNLTDAARLLKTQGHTYQEAISTLHRRHPNLARDNVRRAVGRAFGGVK